MTSKRHKYTFLLLLTLGSLLPGVSLAEQVLMQNGDRISGQVRSGQVKKIIDGELFIKPAYADEFSVEMAAVESIQSSAVYEIELADGSEILASFVYGASGRQTLATEDGEYEVHISELVDAAEPEPWYERSGTDKLTHFCSKNGDQKQKALTNRAQSGARCRNSY